MLASYFSVLVVLGASVASAAPMSPGTDDIQPITTSACVASATEVYPEPTSTDVSDPEVTDVIIDDSDDSENPEVDDSDDSEDVDIGDSVEPEVSEGVTSFIPEPTSTSTGVPPAASSADPRRLNSGAFLRSGRPYGARRFNEDWCIAAGKNAGDKVTLESCRSSVMQYWQWDEYNRGQLYVKNFFTGDERLCMVPPENPTNGTKLEMGPCIPEESFTFGDRHWVIAGNYVELYDKDNTGFCVDLTEGVAEQGTELQLWHCDHNKEHNPNQMWHF